jgi:very-short-patch-repair endonuclease
MAVGYKYSIIPQVHLDELVKPADKGNSRIFSFRHINQKSVDFVICNKKSMHPLLAIELDGDSHKRQDYVERDLEVERILKDAQVPLKRFDNNQNINSVDLEKQIEEIIL